MTNTLRYRIAAAIESVRIQRDGDAAEMADAVIRELQLHEENGWFGPTNIPKHRYVTDWIADE